MPERLFVVVLLVSVAFGCLAGGNIPAFLAFITTIGVYSIYIGVKG